MSKGTFSRLKDFCYRLNLLAFQYTLLVFKKSHTSSEEVEREGEEELALLFLCEEVYYEQFYEEQETSAVVQLEKKGFVKLHVRCSDSQPRRIYHNETLQLEIRIGEDYELEEST